MTTTKEQDMDKAYILIRIEREYDDSTPVEVPVRVVLDKSIAEMWEIAATDGGAQVRVQEVPLGMPGFVPFIPQANVEVALGELRARLTGDAPECEGTADGRHEMVYTGLEGDLLVEECRACGNKAGE